MGVQGLELLKPETGDPETDQDEPKIAHIVKKGDDMRGYVEGSAIMALCGKVWVPTRDPAPLPVCEQCKEIKAKLMGAGAN